MIHLEMTIRAAITVAAFGTSALAHDGDIGIRVTSGTLETVPVAGEPPSQVFGTNIERVFAAEWVHDAITHDVRIDEPGLASEASLLAGRSLGFNLLGLAEWNGSDFAASTMSAGVGGSDLGLPFLNTPNDDIAVTGHTIVVPQLPFDFHYEWRLNGATASSGFGIYLLALELTNPGGVLVKSDPLYIVFNYGMSEEDHDAAIRFAVQNYVPAPGAAALTLFGVMALRRRR